jgi:hypothetical protein
MSAATPGTSRSKTTSPPAEPEPIAGNGLAKNEAPALDDDSTIEAPDPKRPKYARRQAPAGIEKLPPRLSCGRASGRGFFTAYPDPDQRPNVMLVKPDGSDLDDEDYMLVDADAEDDLADVGIMYELVLCRTRSGAYFLWRIKCEDSDGRIDGFNESAREALEEHAGGRWIKLKSDKKARAYEVVLGPCLTTPVRWPEFDIDDLVKRAFKGRIITGDDHKLIRELRGEA